MAHYAQSKCYRNSQSGKTHPRDIDRCSKWNSQLTALSRNHRSARRHEKEKLTNTYKAAATDGDNDGLILTSTFLRTRDRSDKMKRIAPLAGLVVATLLGGCAVYPDGTPMYSNGYGGNYSGYDGYDDGYVTGVPVVPQSNVYMGYSNYPGPGYYNGPGRYYGPGPGYGGYPDRGRPNNGNRGDNGGWHGQPNGGSHGGPPPQGAVGGPRGPSGSNAPRPGAGSPPPPPPQQQQAGNNGGGRGNGNNSAPVRGVPGRQSGQMTDH